MALISLSTHIEPVYSNRFNVEVRYRTLKPFAYEAELAMALAYVKLYQSIGYLVDADFRVLEALKMLMENRIVFDFGIEICSNHGIYLFQFEGVRFFSTTMNLDYNTDGLLYVEAGLEDGPGYKNTQTKIK